MAIRPILEVPDPRLKQVSRPVTAFDDDLRELVADMFETMYDAPGIGLAAVQVGVPLRVLVIDLQDEVDPDVAGDVCGDEQCGHDHRPRRRTPRVFVNPEILDPSPDLSLYNEGCRTSTPTSSVRPRSVRAGRTSTARVTKRRSTACSPPACSTRWIIWKASSSSTASRA
jgi:peptide deformylase